MTLRLNGSTSGYTELDAPAVAGNNLITLPTSNGSAGQLLKNGTTAGALGWSSLVEDSSGRVGIGTTTPGNYNSVFSTVIGNTSSTNNGLVVSTSSTGSAWIGFNNTGGSEIPGYIKYDNSNSSLQFQVNGGERFRCDSSGRLLVGTSSSRQVGEISHTQQIEGGNAVTGFSLVRCSPDAGQPVITFGKARGSSVGSTTIVQSGDFLGSLLFAGADGSTLTSTASRIDAVVEGTPAVGKIASRLVFSVTRDSEAAPSEAMRIQNTGAVDINTAGPSSGQSRVYLSGRAQSYAIDAKSWADTVMFADRKSNDGALFIFRQDGTDEGSISVSGTTVSYNGAHLSRWSQIPGIDPHDKTDRPEILRGTVMSNLDEMCDWIDPESGETQDNEQLNKTKISDVEGDKSVAGIFQSWDDDDDTWVNDYYLAMTGDFIIRIAEGVTVERGDLLMSAGDGTAKPQDDDIIRSKTIAKVTSTTVSCTYEDGSYCVPCVLMAC